MSAERWRSSRVCVGLHSAPVSRSLGKEMGATRVVVVILLPRCGVREARRGGSGLRGSSRNGFGSFCENEFEETEKFANLRASDDEWGQEAQGEIVSAIDHQALTEGLGGERIAVDGKFDAEDQAFAANFAASLVRPARSSALRARTFSRSFLSSMMVRNSRAVAQTNGPPPKVVPCRPGPMRAAMASLVRIAPRGRPAASGLAMRTMSGLEENFW